MAPRKLDLATSSNVRDAAYDPDTQQLDCSFWSGSSGYYAQVPAQVAQEFERASSPGRFVHTYLKGTFTWVPL
jgi:hypothetical protein